MCCWKKSLDFDGRNWVKMCKTVRNKSDISIEKWMFSIKLAKFAFLRIPNIVFYTLDFNRLYNRLYQTPSQPYKYVAEISKIFNRCRTVERTLQRTAEDWSKSNSYRGFLDVKHRSEGRYYPSLYIGCSSTWARNGKNSQLESYLWNE